MTQVQRCNWAEKRAATAACILNHMLSFFYSDATKFARIILSRRHATSSRVFRGSAELFQNLCGALSRGENTLHNMDSQNIFLATAQGIPTELESARAKSAGNRAAPH
jgi:hypothetical protein